MRFKNRRFRVAAVLVAAVAILAFVSGAWAVISGGTPPATFRIQLDGETIRTAKSYQLDAANVNADKKSFKEYTLQISLQLTDNTGPAMAFQTGQTFASAKIDLLNGDLTLLETNELVNATVVSFQQSGNAATNTFGQQLVLKSRTLNIITPSP